MLSGKTTLPTLCSYCTCFPGFPINICIQILTGSGWVWDESLLSPTVKLAIEVIWLVCSVRAFLHLALLSWLIYSQHTISAVLKQSTFSTLNHSLSALGQWPTSSAAQYFCFIQSPWFSFWTPLPAPSPSPLPDPSPKFGGCHVSPSWSTWNPSTWCNASRLNACYGISRLDCPLLRCG